jgi:rSAM/selenodomain-associated transferase 2
MKLSIITPVLNEASGISEFLLHLRAQVPSAEILVADGGSNDGTVDLARRLADELSLRVIESSRDRAGQMNAGAREASGEVLWFVHADSRVPADCEKAIVKALAEPGVVVGCLRLRFPRADLVYRISDSWGNLAVDVFGFAFGDHGIFCRRDHFFAVGGFPNVPLMEDAEFCRALKRFGRMRQLRQEIQTSPRRYERHGPIRTTLFYLLILTLYLCRVSLFRLAQLHQRFSDRPRVPGGKYSSELARASRLAPVDSESFRS